MSAPPRPRLPVRGVPGAGERTRRASAGERTIVVYTGEDKTPTRFEAEELVLLADSAGAEVLECICLRLRHPNPATFLRPGQLESVCAMVPGRRADLVIFSHDLSPGQERNLEKRLSCRVLSKTGLILDIFAQRARTREGKLQVELAQLNHLRTRLVRGWTHLERQKGGIGMHGPGESQLETDRRLLQNRLRYLEKQVGKIRRQRSQSRRPRQRSGLLTVALVGYTNAGKSTLFRALSRDERVYCADQLFATLDPTVRRLLIPGVGRVALVDTVGFVSGLPHQLIHAFRATLDEVRSADLLLHVIDSTHPDIESCIDSVGEVLRSLDAHNIARIDVYNKIDVSGQRAGEIRAGVAGSQVAVSASGGEGIGDLTDLIRFHLQRHDLVQGWYRLLPDQQRLRTRLHSIRAILKEEFNTDGSVNILVRLSGRAWERLGRGLGIPQKIRAPARGRPDPDNDAEAITAGSNAGLACTVAKAAGRLN